MGSGANIYQGCPSGTAGAKVVIIQMLPVPSWWVAGTKVDMHGLVTQDTLCRGHSVGLLSRSRMKVSLGALHLCHLGEIFETILVFIAWDHRDGMRGA